MRQRDRDTTTDAGVLQTKDLTQTELDQVIFSNKVGKDKTHESFWSEISEFLIAGAAPEALTSGYSIGIAAAPYHRRVPSRQADETPVRGEGDVDEDRGRLALSVRARAWLAMGEDQRHRAADCRRLSRSVSESPTGPRRPAHRCVDTVQGALFAVAPNILVDVGTWSKEEEEELTRIVTEITVNQGKDMDNDIFWGVVSQRMGGKRGRQQCRIKW